MYMYRHYLYLYYTCTLYVVCIMTTVCYGGTYMYMYTHTCIIMYIVYTCTYPTCTYNMYNHVMELNS